ncbi:MAG: hypothetical protein ACHQ01_07195 [Candidatus Limnocylindrales bacterium]
MPRDYATIRVVADQAPARPVFESSAMPIEVFVTASQLIDRDLAARRSRAGSFSSRQRRLRVLAGGGSSPAARAVSIPDQSLNEHGPEHEAKPSRPDISWLRP